MSKIFQKGDKALINLKAFENCVCTLEQQKELIHYSKHPFTIKNVIESYRCFTTIQSKYFSFLYSHEIILYLPVDSNLVCKKEGKSK